MLVKSFPYLENFEYLGFQLFNACFSIAQALLILWGYNFQAEQIVRWPSVYYTSQLAWNSSLTPSYYPYPYVCYRSNFQSFRFCSAGIWVFRICFTFKNFLSMFFSLKRMWVCCVSSLFLFKTIWVCFWKKNLRIVYYLFQILMCHISSFFQHGDLYYDVFLKLSSNHFSNLVYKTNFPNFSMV